jgi:hypothetical protein
MRAFANDTAKVTASTDAKTTTTPTGNVVSWGFGQGKVEIPLFNTINEQDKYKSAFTIFDQHVKHPSVPLNKTTDQYFIKSMELVYGGTEGKNTLVGDINYTPGIIAEIALAWNLTQPESDIARVNQNQAMVQELVRNKELYNVLHAKLHKLASLEESLLACYRPEDAVFYQNLEKASFYLSFLPKTSPKLVGLYNSLTNFMSYSLTAVGGPIMTAACTAALATALANHTWVNNNAKLRPLRPMIIAYTAFFTPMMALGTYINFKKQAGERALLRQTQKQMIDVATYVHTLQEIYDILKKNGTFKSNFAHLDLLAHLFEHRGSQKVTRLLSMLSYNTFKGEPSFWFSYHGRILATYALLQETKHELCDAIMAGGQIGALMSAAQLYLEHQDTPVKYSFVEFINNERPYIQATNAWNPRLDPATAIPSSFEMGGASAYNMILTGGNGLGKSTIMKGLLYELLIAQTFGIAPAEKLVMTPFARMICHTNISDNVAEGLSGFTAELAMKDRILKDYAQLKPNQFIITVFDELFKSTNPEDAAKLSKQLCKSLAAHSNSISIIATHLAPVTELEVEGTHANYHPGSIAQGEGLPVKPTYTLEKGASFDHNAQALYNQTKN